MSHADDYTHGPWSIVLGLSLGVSIVGFFTGTAPPAERATSPTVQTEAPPHTPEPGQAEEASSYLDRRRPTDLQWSRLSDVLARIGKTDSPVLDKAQALEQRRSRRAYSGAPPRIPHGIDQGEDGACLACHREGMQIGSETASTIPHAELRLCTQCHVPTQDLIPGGDALEPGLHGRVNTFEGLEEPENGPQSQGVDSPPVPHTSWMRENCSSCHGPLGSKPLQTLHPERKSCTQCHALSDVMEQGE
jgi:cytochrome c-type protein NapB